MISSFFRFQWRFFFQVCEHSGNNFHCNLFLILLNQCNLAPNLPKFVLYLTAPDQPDNCGREWSREAQRAERVKEEFKRSPQTPTTAMIRQQSDMTLGTGVDKDLLISPRSDPGMNDQRQAQLPGATRGGNLSEHSKLPQQKGTNPSHG